MTLSKDAIEINKRFVQAINALIENNTFRGKAAFPRIYNYNKWNFAVIMNEPETHSIRYEWLGYLNRDYNISLEWLMLGVGSMFKDKFTNLNEAETALCSNCDIRKKYCKIHNIINEEQ